MTKLSPRLSFANVMSLVAVFIALGGTAYAALKLPKNSVGAKQIKSGAVRSAEVKDFSLQAKDLAKGLPAGEKGERGPEGPGPPGSPGQPGAPATKIYAFVRTGSCCGGGEPVLATPELINAHGIVAATVAGTGKYEAKIDTRLLPRGSVNNSVPVATVGSHDAAPPVAGEIAVAHPGGIPDDRLLVLFRNSAGTAFADLGSGGGSDGFSIALFC
jgi:hypothetical protein